MNSTLPHIPALTMAGLLLTLSGCGLAMSTQTINFGQGNIIISRGTQTTATLEGITLQIVHPGVRQVSAQTYVVSSAPDGPSLKVYKIQIGAQSIELTAANSKLSLKVNDEAKGDFSSGASLTIDQSGAVQIIQAGPGDSTNAPASP